MFKQASSAGLTELDQGEEVLRLGQLLLSTINMHPEILNSSPVPGLCGAGVCKCTCVGVCMSVCVCARAYVLRG